MGIGILWRSDDFLPDAPGELALLMLVAHIIEMQFLFVVIANTWLFWLMLGVLLADHQPMFDVSVGWTMLPVVGVLFIRQWFPVPAAISAPGVEVVLLTVGILLTVWPRKAYRWQYVAVAAVLLAGASYVLVDTQADQRYHDTLDATKIAHLRPLDVPLQIEAALVALNRAETLPGYGWEQRADRILTHLTRLNRYEPQVAYGLGRLATLREQRSATAYFRAAHTLSTDNPDYDEVVPGE
jgi:hypothetical protein